MAFWTNEFYSYRFDHKIGKKNQGIGVFINIEKEIIIIVWP